MLVRVTVGFVGLAIIVGVSLPPRGSDGRMRADPDGRMRADPDGAAHPRTVAVLKVAEGESSGTLTVVDESGRQLAALTRLPNGNLAVVSRRGGAGVAFWLNEGQGTASVCLTGTSWQTRLMVHPDGTTETCEANVPVYPVPPGDPRSDGRRGARDLGVEARVTLTKPDPSECSAVDGSPG
jgi:hypothetical protein